MRPRSRDLVPRIRRYVDHRKIRPGDELNSANAFLESVLTGLEAGVAVLDRELRVLAWNGNAEELWGLADPRCRQSPGEGHPL